MVEPKMDIKKEEMDLILNGLSADGSISEEAKKALLDQSAILRGYEEEEVRDSMIADEGVLALVYAGEAKSA